MQAVYFSLGGNRGDREAYLRQALHRLPARGLALVRVSSLYETLPVGGEPQPRFLNAVAQGRTTLEPREVLRLLLSVEAELGRHRYRPWGPRTLDLDLLLCGERVIDAPDLQLPHPRLRQRPFVLLPLAEIAPDKKLEDGFRVKDLAARADRSGLNLYRGPGWAGFILPTVFYPDNPR